MQQGDPDVISLRPGGGGGRGSSGLLAPRFDSSSSNPSPFSDLPALRPHGGAPNSIKTQAHRAPAGETTASPELGRTDQLTSNGENDRLTLNSGSAANPYGLPVGCEYFVVTVAMLPDAIHSATAS